MIPTHERIQTKARLEMLEKLSEQIFYEVRNAKNGQGGKPGRESNI